MRSRVVAVVLVGLAVRAAACIDIPELLAGPERAEGTFRRTLSVTGPVNLDIATGSGSVVVVGGSEGQVLIEGRVRASERSGFGPAIGAEERVRRLVKNPPIEQADASIRIGRIEDADLRQNVSISYRVTVPADASVVSRTGSGSQQIEGVERDVAVTAGSGSIRLREIGGAVRAATGSGSITADGVGGAFEARAGSGSIEGTGVAGSITAKTGSGGIRVTQTGEGDVEVSTGSGSIDLAGVRGAVHASTSSGSLNVSGHQMSEWRLATSSGDVNVAMNGSAAFELDAQGSHVDSAYPMMVTGEISRRAIKGSVNGGGPLLRVRTASGRVSIR